MISATQEGFDAPSHSNVNSSVDWMPPGMSSTARSFTPRRRFAPTGTGDGSRRRRTALGRRSGRGHRLGCHVGLGLDRGPQVGADRGDDEAGVAPVDGLAAREDPHGVGELLDRLAAHDLVVVLEGLGDEVDGPRHGKGDEDQSAQVHARSVGAIGGTGTDVKWCVAELLV